MSSSEEGTKPWLRVRRPTWRGWFVIGVFFTLVILISLWGIDYGTLHDRVARNVVVENAPLGRKSPADLHNAITKANATYGKGKVVFVIAGKNYPLGASAIGLHLDEAATLRDAHRIERSDPTLLRPFFWIGSWLVPRKVPIKVDLDRGKLARALAALPGQIPVTEPSVIGSVDAIGVTAGKSGIAFDPDTVATRIEAIARTGTLPLRIPLVAETLEPSVSDASIAALAEQARTITNRTIQINVPGQSMTASSSQLRSWITSIVPPGSHRAHLSMRTQLVRDALVAQFGKTVVAPQSASFTVIGSQVYLLPQIDGQQCCSLTSGSRILAALQASQPTVDAPLRTHAPAFTTKDAQAMGITTLLGAGLESQPQLLWNPTGTPSLSTPPPSTGSTTTTTTLPQVGPPSGGQAIIPIPNRSGQFANVSRAVPLLRGEILQPGKSLSLNTLLGPPSPTNGFVAADVLTADGPTWVSGGGTDLLAAALFQSAYYAGLDIPTATSPNVLRPGVTPGIDATLGWNAPDLVVANPSPKPILIWADVVQGGVRVQLFGTPFTTSVATSTQSVPFGPDNKCLAVNITRTRSFTDGRQIVDRFSARYTPPPDARDDPNRVICPT